jgi:hypothetical protein
VVDPKGAPDLHTGVERVLVRDVVLDCLEVFDGVERALSFGQLTEYNPDSLLYNPSEDPFPRPKVGSTVTRFDLAPFPLPPPDPASGRQTLPDTLHFRKLAVYVEHGKVIAVRERVEMQSMLEKLKRPYKLTYPPGSTKPEREAIALQAINALRTRAGVPVIQLHDMALELDLLGERKPIELPATDTKADLSWLFGRALTSRVAGSAAQGASQ